MRRSLKRRSPNHWKNHQWDAGIRNITSQSSQGSSSITVEFELGTALEEAANDVRDKVSQAIRNLPSDLDAPPVVSKADNSSDP